MTKDPERWTVTASRISYEDRWIRVRSDDCRRSDGVVIAPYHVLEYPDWIALIPVLADGRILLVKEYRHGRGEVVAGLISGGVSAGDLSTADPLEAAARRELKEEAGYGSGVFRRVLDCYPNPAIQSNLAAGYLAFDLAEPGERALDESEEIVLMPARMSDVLRDVQAGRTLFQAIHVAVLHAAMIHVLSADLDLPGFAAMKADVTAYLGGLGGRR